MMDGIINVYKEKGYTSHDVVAKLRGILKQKKIGHTGTLDPEAQGVLPVCLGKATKVCDLLTDKQKTYQAVLLLGRITDTQDTTGAVLAEHEVTADEQEVRACIAGFVGEQEQIPPMYSALKVNGKKLYELARQGIEVERRPRQITIHEIEIDEVRLPEIVMTVTCSKGTYIRTLCHDIGAALGCGGCMKSLLRTKVGPFELSESVRLEEIAAMRDAGTLAAVIKNTDSVFGQLGSLILSEGAERLVRNGNPLNEGILQSCRIAWEEVRCENEVCDSTEEKKASGTQALEQKKTAKQMQDGMQFRVYGGDGTFLAVYEWKKQKHCCQAVKMFL